MFLLGSGKSHSDWQVSISNNKFWYCHHYSTSCNLGRAVQFLYTIYCIAETWELFSWVETIESKSQVQDLNSTTLSLSQRKQTDQMSWTFIVLLYQHFYSVFSELKCWAAILIKNLLFFGKWLWVLQCPGGYVTFQWEAALMKTKCGQYSVKTCSWDTRCELWRV